MLSTRKTLLWEYPFCFWCDCALDENTVTIEHIIPRSRGGSSRLHNLVPACRSCNNAQGNPEVSQQEAQQMMLEYKQCAKRLSPYRNKPVSQRKKITETLSRVDWVNVWKTWYSKTYPTEAPFGEALNIPMPEALDRAPCGAD